ncbi:coniferyl aldehyde dehydrogenase [Parahaliea mediterranea]|uniref:coniferyl aldehyde dehydrogenase n=1 Tax=Parahaliea mediterranea TaxID=651086 RepID=UPI000E2F140F|nr:coniferyl aldehyde dehydrogenase [Parahaliea mediterranea]
MQDKAVDTPIGDTGVNEGAPSLDALLHRQRRAFQAVPYPDAKMRIDWLNRCIALLVDHHVSLCDAVNEDFGCRSPIVTRMTDIGTSLTTLKYVRKNVKRWMRAEKRRAPFPMGLVGGKCKVHYQPKGVVGIMTPWNVPINMVFSPLADVFGAGNRALIKPSEFTPHTAELLQSLFAEYFAPEEAAVVTGGAEVGAAFSSQPLDHLIFTGSTRVGQAVMKSAAQNLTPVTLELGGKSPVIVSASADLGDVADKLVAGKSMNSGQVCISPDLCFVPEQHLEKFVELCRERFTEHFPTVVGNPDYVAMINDRNYLRVKGMLDEAGDQGARVLSLDATGGNWREASGRQIPLHLVVNPPESLRVMQEELFGPVLCVLGYRDFQDCVEQVRVRPRPLALYYFGKDRDEQNDILHNTVAGAMTINDVAFHYACDDMPFGGVGASGFGQYHGVEGFRTFSHAKSVYTQGVVNLPKIFGMLPPYTQKLETLSVRMIKR